MAVDMFLKIDGVKGESKDKSHPDEIHVESFSWGLSQSGTFGSGGGGGAGKVSVHDMSFTKVVDKSSPDLMLACAGGKHYANALVTVRKAGEKPLEYLKIKLKDVLISGIQTAGHGGGDSLSENLTLNFAKFEVEYTPQKADGSGDTVVKIGWDVKANTKI